MMKSKTTIGGNSKRKNERHTLVKIKKEIKKMKEKESILKRYNELRVSKQNV